MKSPKVPAPSQAELDLAAQQKAESEARLKAAADEKAQLLADKKTAAEDAQRRRAGGARSLLSRDWAGFQRPDAPATEMGAL